LTIWELRFADGRGASFYTQIDVTADIGRSDGVRRLDVAASVFEGSALENARRCFDEGRVQELVANMSAVAYALRHDL
jgi:hypothetical protein